MKRNTEWSTARLASLTLAAGMVSAATIAAAQETAPAAPTPEAPAVEAPSATEAPATTPADGKAIKLDKVQVTGSRIVKRDNFAESPIYTVTQQDVKVSGNTAVEQYLNTLPQVVPNLSSQSNNPSSNGRATVDLRGLGANRNLVLIDGRRPMGSFSGGTVDINTIPAALIERVELISGGAAATYGPDAVAGVVNFITRTRFDGFAIDGGYRITDKNDGIERSTDLTFGNTFADGKGNAVFNAGYFNREAIGKGARSFSAQASSTTGSYPGGSWSTGTNTPTQASVDALFGAGRCANNGGVGGFGFNPDGTLFCTGVANDPRDITRYTGPASDVATRFAPDIFSYNFEPDNLLVLPLERYNLFSAFNLNVNDYFNPYLRAQYTNYNALQQLAATPASGSTGFTVPTTNPFLTAELRNLLASRATPNAPFTFSKRFNGLGPRTGYTTHDVWQLTLGTKGDLIAGFDYDLYGSFGRSVLNEAQNGNVRRDRTQAALNAADGGASLCTGGLNLFGSAPISQSCKDYIGLEAKNLTTIEQGIAEGVITGDLFKLPAGAVQSAFGASYRNQFFDFRPDSGLQPGLVAGFNEQKPVKGDLNYLDYFGEVSVPLVAEVPFVKELSASLAFRNTDNNKFGDAQTWKVGLDWTVNNMLRTRASLQHAVRSPDINELFAPQLNNFPTFTNQDPCNVSGPNASNNQFGRNGANGANVRNLCAAQSAVAGGATYTQPAGQATAIVGGNPNLQPEEADTWSAGFVFTPKFDHPLAKRLSLTVDYWSISLENVIAALDAATIVQRCYNRDGANPTYSASNEYCQLFIRDQSNGGVIGLQQLSRNQAFIDTSGVDITTNWGFNAGPGKLDFSLVATWLESYKTQTTTVDPIYEYAGTIGATTGSATPEWKGTLITTYGMDNWKAYLTTRYLDGMSHANVVSGGSPVANTGTESVWYVDLAGSYEVIKNLTLRAGVSNLTNEGPQIYTPNVQANTDPSTYDVLGRRYFFGINYKL